MSCVNWACSVLVMLHMMWVNNKNLTSSCIIDLIGVDPSRRHIWRPCQDKATCEAEVVRWQEVVTSAGSSASVEVLINCSPTLRSHGLCLSPQKLGDSSHQWVLNTINRISSKRCSTSPLQRTTCRRVNICRCTTSYWNTTSHRHTTFPSSPSLHRGRTRPSRWGFDRWVEKLKERSTICG